MTNARIRSPLARRASLIDARNRNERNDQIFANTLSAYIVPARDSRSKNVKADRKLLVEESVRNRRFCRVTRHVSLMSELKSVTDARRGA